MIALANDFAGLELKNRVKEYLDSIHEEYVDFGSNTEETVDYPEYAWKAANAVKDKRCDLGILFCGTGIGISLAANKVKGIRCAVCTDCYSARMSREHNNANMLALGGRVVGRELAVEIVKAWLGAEFLGGVHQKRIDMITAIEEGVNV